MKLTLHEQLALSVHAPDLRDALQRLVPLAQQNYDELMAAAEYARGKGHHAVAFKILTDANQWGAALDQAMEVICAVNPLEGSQVTGLQIVGAK